MKDLGEASYVLGIQIIRDYKNKILALSQASYIDKVLAHFSMQNSKKGLLPTRHGIVLSKEQCPKTPQEEEDMRRVPYASAVGSLMYAMLCTRPDICYAVGMVSRFQSNPGLDHWIAVKHILKFLRRTKNYMLVYSGGDLNCWLENKILRSRSNRKKQKLAEAWYQDLLKFFKTLLNL